VGGDMLVFLPVSSVQRGRVIALLGGPMTRTRVLGGGAGGGKLLGGGAGGGKLLGGGAGGGK